MDEFDKLLQKACATRLLYPWALPPPGGFSEIHVARAQLLKCSRAQSSGPEAALWDVLVPTWVWGRRGLEQQ